MKKIAITFLMIFSMLVASTVPGEAVMASKPQPDYDFSEAVPQKLIWWLNNTSHSKDTKIGKTHKEFVKAYKKEQGYILVPQIDDAALDNVRWGKWNVAVNYGFHNNDISWRMYVYPMKDCKKENFYSEDIVSLVDKRDGGIELNKEEKYETATGWCMPEPCTLTTKYVKKKLQLGDHTFVDCIQRTDHRKYKNFDSENISVYLYFIKAGMYVRVCCDRADVGQENKVADALQKCTFKKMPTNAQLTLNKNKETKKNVILNATLQNPTNKKFTLVELRIYDKKIKKYRLIYRKKMRAKSRKKEKVSLKFNVQKCINDWGKSGKTLSLERKKKYKYKICAKVNGENLVTAGTFKLK